VSFPLDSVLANALEGTSLTCTLSPESVQVLFFALGFVTERWAWQEDADDSVSDSEWGTIQSLISRLAYEVLP